MRYCAGSGTRNPWNGKWQIEDEKEDEDERDGSWRFFAAGHMHWDHEPSERKRGNAAHSKRCREIRADLEELSRWFMESGFSRLRMYWGDEPQMAALCRDAATRGFGLPGAAVILL